MKTSFTQKQYDTIIKMALEKGIVIGKAGQGPLFKKSNAELAQAHVKEVQDDIESLLVTE